MPSTCSSELGIFSMTSKSSLQKRAVKFFACTGPMPLTVPLPRYGVWRHRLKAECLVLPAMLLVNNPITLCSQQSGITPPYFLLAGKLLPRIFPALPLHMSLSSPSLGCSCCRVWNLKISYLCARSFVLPICPVYTYPPCGLSGPQCR